MRGSGEVIHIHYRLLVTFEEIGKWAADCLPPTDQEDDRWMFAVEAAVRDRLPDLLERVMDEPDVEIG